MKDDTILSCGGTSSDCLQVIRMVMAMEALARRMLLELELFFDSISTNIFHLCFKQAQPKFLARWTPMKEKTKLAL